MMFLFLLENQIIWRVVQLGEVLCMFLMLHTLKYWRLHFQRKNHITMNWFFKNKLKVVMMRVNVMKNNFLIWHNCICVIINIFKIICWYYFNKHTCQLKFKIQNFFPFVFSGVFILLLHQMIHLVFPMHQYWNIYHSPSYLYLLYLLPK